MGALFSNVQFRFEQHTDLKRGHENVQFCIPECVSGSALSIWNPVLSLAPMGALLSNVQFRFEQHTDLKRGLRERTALYSRMPHTFRVLFRFSSVNHESSSCYKLRTSSW